MDSEDGRFVVVTGGGTGIGRGIAEAFAGHGDRVVLVARREEVLRKAATELGPRVSYRKADVSQRAQVTAAVDSIVRKSKTIDVLVNNAGFPQSVLTTTAIETAERAWDTVVDANLKGSFLMTMAVAPHLPRPGGRIINISSIAAFTGGSRPGAIPYAAAKAGLLGLTYSLARELSPRGITVNAIAPGLITETEFTAGFSEERIQSTVAQTPAGRTGHPRDIAAAAMYLASPEASFVTGAVLHVNGGWLFGR